MESNYNDQTLLQNIEILDILEGDGKELKTPNHLWYYKRPAHFPLDLSEGYTNYVLRIPEYEKSNLKKNEIFIIKNDFYKNIRESAKELTKICTQRGLLVNIFSMTLKRTNCTIYATKYNDVIYLVLKSKHQNKQILPRNNSNVSPPITHYFKFVQNCFSESPQNQRNTDIPVNENIQQYCIYRAQLKDFELLYAGEMWGIIADNEVKDITDMDEINKCRFTKTVTTPSDKNFYSDNKRFKWWAQCYFANINDLKVGLKNRSAEIIDILNINVNSIAMRANWDPYRFNGFLHKFLTEVDNTMISVNCPYTVYEFEYDNKHSIIKNKIHMGKTDLSFLSEEYVNYIQKN